MQKLYNQSRTRLTWVKSLVVGMRTDRCDDQADAWKSRHHGRTPCSLCPPTPAYHDGVCGRMDGWTDGWMGGWKYAWVDGNMHGWIDRQMDG